VFETSRRTHASLVVSLMTMVALSGCANQNVAEPADAPAASATPVSGTNAPDTTATPTPMAMATGTPSPTATAADSEDPNSWVIDFAGVGPLMVGQARDGAEARMSAFTRSGEDECGPNTFFRDAVGFPDILVADPSDTGVIQSVVVEKWGAPASVGTSPLRTREGIGIGATLDELEAAYPALVPKEGDYGTYYGVTNGSGRWINFNLTVDGLVDTIAVDTSPEMATEYCG
jgi:hypothetical protein